MEYYFQSNSVKNSLKCPKAKSATHCLTKLFPIYQNKHWITAGPMSIMLDGPTPPSGFPR